MLLMRKADIKSYCIEKIQCYTNKTKYVNSLEIMAVSGK